MSESSEREELRLLREQVRELIQLHLDEQQEINLLREIRDKLPTPQKLSTIKLAFLKGDSMAEGPVTLSVGQTTVATVDGFDQNGAPFSGPVPTPTFAMDNSAIATVDASGNVVAVSAGVANLTATVVTAEGVTLSDTETVTVTAAAPVLSSIKINFSVPK